MGHPDLDVGTRHRRHETSPVLRTLFPTFPPLSTSIAPLLHLALHPPSRLPSNDALLLNSKPTNFAPFRENPQQKPPFFAPPGHLPPINTGIRTANTICCALYLTHPTEGVIFTTAPPQETFGSPYFLYRSSAADALPAGFNHAPPKAEKSSQKPGQTHRPT